MLKTLRTCSQQIFPLEGELDLELALSKDDGGEEVLLFSFAAALASAEVIWRPVGELGELDLLLLLVLSPAFSTDK